MSPSPRLASPDTRRLAGLAGLVGVAGNVLGVAFLHDAPAAYRLARLEEWWHAVGAQPLATVASAVGFTAGLAGLALWAHQLGREGGTPRARFGAAALSGTALANAAACLLPAVLAVSSRTTPLASAVRLLHASLAFDAAFNLGLGLGLLGYGLARGRPHGLGWLACAAGLASLPVAAQAVWDPAASVLYVAAPLWLAVVTISSFGWLRSHASEAL